MFENEEKPTVTVPDEGTEQTGAVAEVAEVAAEPSVPVKTYTEQDINNAVENRLRRERRKYKDYEDLKAVVELVKTKGGFTGDSPQEVKEALDRFYGEQGEQTSFPAGTDSTKPALSAEERTALAEINAVKFVRSAEPEDLEDEFERLKDRGKKRSDEEDARFEIVRKAYEQIKTEAGNRRQLADFTAKYPNVSVDDLKADEDFKRFAAISTKPLLDTYELYVEMLGKSKKPKKEIGSVASAGTTVEKTSFTREEVAAMSPDEVRKNMDAIEKSMRHWK